MARRAYERETSQISSSPALTEVALNLASWEFGTQADRRSWGQFSASTLSSALKKEKGRGKVPSKLPAFLAAPKRWPHCLLNSPDRMFAKLLSASCPNIGRSQRASNFSCSENPELGPQDRLPRSNVRSPTARVGNGNEDDDCNARPSAGLPRQTRSTSTANQISEAAIAFEIRAK
jgi:hypothetical protein